MRRRALGLALDDYRRFYAEEIEVVAGIRSRALIQAFASVPREHFLGPGPWKLGSLEFGASPTPRYVSTQDADPRRIYHNVLVSIDETRHLNNGQPSALASWLDALDIREGERVVHVGAGDRLLLRHHHAGCRTARQRGGNRGG